jgi:WD40 repeat protein
VIIRHSVGAVLDITPDARRLLCLDHGELMVRETRTGDRVMKLDDPPSKVDAADFSPDGRFVVSHPSWMTKPDLHVWDAASGAALSSVVVHGEGLHSTAISPDGTRLATASYPPSFRLWELPALRAVSELIGHDGMVLSCCFSPDGKWLLSASTDGTCVLWDAAGGAGIRAVARHGRDVNSCGFSPNGRRLFSASADATVKLWDPDTTVTEGAAAGQTWPITVYRPAPDEGLLTAGMETAIAGRILSVSPDGRWLAAVTGPDRVGLYDTETAAVTRSLTFWDGEPIGARFSPGNRFLTVWHKQGVRMILRVWDLFHDDEPGRDLDTHFLQGELASWGFAPDERHLFALSQQSGSLTIWDTQSYSLIASVRLPRHPAEQRLSLWDDETTGYQRMVTICAWSPTGRYLATASGGDRIVVWDTDGSARTDFHVPASVVTALCWSGDGSVLAVTAASGAPLYLGVETGRLTG